MEDGPEEAESVFEYSGSTYRLVEEESEKWKVYAAGVLLGTVAALPASDSEIGPLYTVRVADEREYAEETTDDWRRAVETLIDRASF